MVSLCWSNFPLSSWEQPNLSTFAHKLVRSAPGEVRGLGPSNWKGASAGVEGGALGQSGLGSAGRRWRVAQSEARAKLGRKFDVSQPALLRC